MRHRLYRYNPDSFRFEPVVPERRGVVRKLLWATLAGFLLAGALTGLDQLRTVTYEERLVAESKTKLLTSLQAQRAHLEQVQSSLFALHQRDNGFYRSILGLDRIDPSAWAGGRGGSEEYTLLELPVQQDVAILVDRLRYQAQLQRTSFALLEEVAAKKSTELKHIPAVRPTLGGPLVSGFGYRSDPFTGVPQFHPGLDFVVPSGTKVHATGAGVVVRAGVSESGYGIQVEVDHGFGYVSKYAHLSRVAVQVGDTVARDQVIAYSGNTGYSVAPHLHYEVIKNGVKVNPVDYFYSTR